MRRWCVKASSAMPEINIDAMLGSASGVGILWLAIRQDIKLLLMRIGAVEDRCTVLESKKIGR